MRGRPVRKCQTVNGKSFVGRLAGQGVQICNKQEETQERMLARGDLWVGKGAERRYKECVH